MIYSVNYNFTNLAQISNSHNHLKTPYIPVWLHFSPLIFKKINLLTNYLWIVSDRTGSKDLYLLIPGVESVSILQVNLKKKKWLGFQSTYYPSCYSDNKIVSYANSR